MCGWMRRKVERFQDERDEGRIYNDGKLRIKMNLFLCNFHGALGKRFAMITALPGQTRIFLLLFHSFSLSEGARLIAKQPPSAFAIPFPRSQIAAEVDSDAVVNPSLSRGGLCLSKTLFSILVHEYFQSLSNQAPQKMNFHYSILT